MGGCTRFENNREPLSADFARTTATHTAPLAAATLKLPHEHTEARRITGSDKLAAVTMLQKEMIADAHLDTKRHLVVERALQPPINIQLLVREREHSHI